MLYSNTYKIFDSVARGGTPASDTILKYIWANQVQLIFPIRYPYAGVPPSKEDHPCSGFSFWELLKYYNVPYSLIKTASDKKQLDSLHWMLRLRSRFNNRSIYNFTLEYGARLLNCSIQTVHSHYKVWIKNGWAIKHDNGTLKFTGINKLREGSWCIKIPVMYSKKAQLAQLRWALVKKNLRSQDKAYKLKTHAVQYQATAGVRLSKNQIKWLRQNEQSKVNEPTLSNKSIGALLGMSQTSGKRYQKFFNQLGVIRSVPNFILVKEKVSPAEYAYTYYGDQRYFYNRETQQVHKQTSNIIRMQCS